MNKDEMMKILQDGLDFASVCYISTCNRAEQEGEVLTIPAPVIMAMVENLSGVFRLAMEQVEPGSYENYVKTCEPRIMQRIEEAAALAEKLGLTDENVGEVIEAIRHDKKQLH